MFGSFEIEVREVKDEATFVEAPRVVADIGDTMVNGRLIFLRFDVEVIVTVLVNTNARRIPNWDRGSHSGFGLSTRALPNVRIGTTSSWRILIDEGGGLRRSPSECYSVVRRRGELARLKIR